MWLEPTHLEVLQVKVDHPGGQGGDNDLRPFQGTEGIDRVKADPDEIALQLIEDSNQHAAGKPFVVLNCESHLAGLELGDLAAQDLHHLVG